MKASQGEKTNSSGSEDELRKSVKSNFRKLFHEWIFFQMRIVRGEDLSMPQLFMLRFLYYNRPKDMSSIASFMGVSRPTITGIMNTLEKDGFIRRTRDGRGRDRRRTDIILTRKSLDMFSRFENLTMFIVEDFLGSIPEDAMVNLNSTMLSLAEKLKEIEELENKGGKCYDRK